MADEIRRPERVTEERWANLSPVARKIVAEEEGRRCGCTLTNWTQDYTMAVATAECPLHKKGPDKWGYFWGGAVTATIALVAFIFLESLRR